MISRGAPSRPKAGGPSHLTPRAWATGTLLHIAALIAGMALGALIGWLNA